MSAELSLKSNIFLRTHGLEDGIGAGGRGERLLETLCSIERFFQLKTEMKHTPFGYVAGKELCC